MSDDDFSFSKLAEWLWGMVFVNDSTQRLYWFYVFIFIAISSCLYITRKPESKSMLSFIFPKKIFFSKSSFADIQIYLINGALGIFINLATLIASTALISEFFSRLLFFLFGETSNSIPFSHLVHLLFGIAILLLTDFSVFITHFLHHKLPVLWSFHKTHHSAEVLTPITAHRFHPVELVINGLVLALCVGPIIGIYQYLFDMSFLKPGTIGVIMVLWLLTANFRHSHIPLHFPNIISRWLVSPAMHNIHHSTNPRHFDKNFGLIFSFWDRLAGTWYLPEKDENLKFGLPNEDSFKTAIGCYISPFRECYSRFQKFIRRFTETKSP